MKQTHPFLLAVMALALWIQACTPENGGKQAHDISHEPFGEPQVALASRILAPDPGDTLVIEELIRTEEEWREQLTAAEYRILRDRGTEIPFINEYWDHKEEGIYYCGGCGLPLFASDTKYRSGTGWPSFWAPVSDRVVEEREDHSFFMTRTEIVCARCGSHIGHVFEDGPEPTGLRYCMNSAALNFRKETLPDR